jgi:hypothetical protein
VNFGEKNPQHTGKMMDTSQFIGFSFSILIGISLGLIGGGGSILTLPVLVYFLGINPVLSTAYSLFVVGTTSLVGCIHYMRNDLVHYRAALAFVLPSFTTVFLTRKYILPAIPDPVFSLAKREVSKEVALMIFFAFTMLMASYSMIKGKNKTPEQKKSPLGFSYSMVLIVIAGALVGLLTGVIGAGGGFLIIPALVLLARLDMKMAVGTSLLIIAVKSLFGFAGDMATVAIDWIFLLEFTLFSVIGIFAGSYLSRYIEGEKLKRTFGWLVLGMSICIISKELGLIF